MSSMISGTRSAFSAALLMRSSMSGSPAWAWRAIQNWYVVYLSPLNTPWVFLSSGTSTRFVRSV